MPTTLPWWIRKRYMTQPQQEQKPEQQQGYKHPENEIALEPMDPKDVPQVQQQGEQTQEQKEGEQTQEQKQ